MCSGIVLLCVCVCAHVMCFFFNLDPLVHIQSLSCFYLVTNESPISVQRKVSKVILEPWGLFISIIIKLLSEATLHVVSFIALAFTYYYFAAGLTDRLFLRHLRVLALIDCEMTSLVVMC